jgi:hypothetical protein
MGETAYCPIGLALPDSLAVKSIAYEIPENLLSGPLLAPLLDALLRAEDVLARLDERARTSPLRAGWQQRLLYGEACASRLAEGELVHLEDLVLLDNGALSGGITPDLSSAWHALGVWRKAVKGDAAALLAAERPGEAAAPAALTPDAPDYFYDPDWGEAERLAAFRRVLRESRGLPSLIAAGIVWDAWLELCPEQRGAWRAPLIAALTLKARGKTRHLLLPIDTGRRFAAYRRHAGHGLATRLAGFLEWLLMAAERANRELDRLVLAEELLRGKLRGRRKNSRLPQLVELLLEKPLVSVPMAARALKCSSQAVEVMIRQLGSTPRELTGRSRYRAWGVV